MFSSSLPWIWKVIQSRQLKSSSSSSTVIPGVDALASRSLKRLCRTVQISDTGITPGSGVGNHRMGLTQDTLGVPVIAVGVPTVVALGPLNPYYAAGGKWSQQKQPRGPDHRGQGLWSAAADSPKTATPTAASSKPSITEPSQARR